MLITRFLQDFIQAGALTLITAEGRTHKFDGPEQGPHITLRLHKRSLEWTLGLNPDPGFGDAHVDGSWTPVLTFRNLLFCDSISLWI